MRGRYEASLEAGSLVERPPQPSTMDLIWDKQCNGTVPQITEIYTTANPQGLPNPLYDDRFKFIKRVNKDDPNSAHQLTNFKINCNQLVTYDSSTGLIGDLSSVNLIVTTCYPYDDGPSFAGILRILYVDE